MPICSERHSGGPRIMSGAGAGIQDVVAAEWLDPGLRRGDKKSAE